MHSARGGRVDLGALAGARSLAAEVTKDVRRPAYEVGWDLARRVRSEVLRLGVTASSDDLDRAASSRLLSRAAHGTFAAEGRLLDGAVANQNESSPIWVAPKGRSPTALRFVYARAVAANALGGVTTALTGSGSLLQRVCRAFAAEFLAPAEALRVALANEDTVDQVQLEELARGFAVSPQVIQHQLENHLIASVVA